MIYLIFFYDTGSDETSDLTESLQDLELENNLPSTKGLNYCQLLCGAIKGALQAVQIETEVSIIADKLRSSPDTKIRIKFIRRITEAIPVGDA